MDRRHRCAEKETDACDIAALQHPKGMEYVSTSFLAHLACGHCGDTAMWLIAKASELYGDALSSGQVVGLRHDCEVCQLAGNNKRSQGLHPRRLGGRATATRELLHVDVAGPVVPLGIGQARYILVAVDELPQYAWVFPMRKKAQTARLLAVLIHRINTQIRRPGEPGMRCLHSDQAGEFNSHLLEEFKASFTPSLRGRNMSPMD